MRKLWFRTYQRSIRTQSTKPISDRPLTCHRQVKPGLTDRRRRCHGSYWATSSPMGGRGPTSDIRPASTWNNCGVSSRLVRRRKRPTRVTRASRRFLKIGPSFSLATSSRRRSASSVIVRNFTMVNGRPRSPSRFWKNSGLPRVVINSVTHTASMTGARTASSANAPTMSRIRLANAVAEPTGCPRPAPAARRRSTGAGPGRSARPSRGEPGRSGSAIAAAGRWATAGQWTTPTNSPATPDGATTVWTGSSPQGAETLQAQSLRFEINRRSEGAAWHAVTLTRTSLRPSLRRRIGAKRVPASPWPCSSGHLIILTLY